MGLSNVSLSVSSNESVGLTSATVSYSCSGSLPKDTNRYEYYDLECYWSFSPGSKHSSSETGSVEIKNLTQGSANTITATVTLKCQVDEYIYNSETKEWEYDDTYTETIDTETVTLTVYTRPGTFSGFDGEKDQLINDVINATSAANWNTHCGKYLSWKNQANKYGTVNIAFPTGQLITATWFNSLRTACGATEDQVPIAVKDQTLITADIFKKLGAAISKS